MDFCYYHNVAFAGSCPYLTVFEDCSEEWGLMLAGPMPEEVE